MTTKASREQRFQAAETYNIARWGGGYFSVNDKGHLTVAPTTDSEDGVIDTVELAKTLQEKGLRWPVLVRFPGILKHRVTRLCQAFSLATSHLNYEGGYCAVYPIKVNQQRRVVEEIIWAGQQPGCHVGLEAGSKPELLAIMAMAPTLDTVLVCNGYKDEEYIRLALIGVKLGYRLHIVIEKLSELDLVLAQAKQLNVKPLLGVRARLSSIGKGNWQNTGGEKSKFGLSADQVLQVVRRLKTTSQLDSLSLLHFHLGSQIANIHDIRTGLQECGRFFTELAKMEVPISTIDVGGGLGVDYEGTGSRSACSMNYTVEEYAHYVVKTFQDAADTIGIAHPHLISESGRAITAHHAMLMTNLIDVESALGHHYQGVETDLSPDSFLNQAISGALDPEGYSDDSSSALMALLHTLSSLQKNDVILGNLLETYHDISFQLSECQAQFIHGRLTLEHRALAESAAMASYGLLREALDISNRNHREVLDELNEKLADKLFVNFSLFQSLPDVWGIDQIFPVMPLDHLNQPVQRRAVIQDITCDSDGRMDLYVDGQGLETTLPIPEVGSSTMLLGFFLVGAYQEILGDMHNLFGDSDAVDVSLDESGQIRVENLVKGDSVDGVLKYVNFDSHHLLQSFHYKLQAAPLTEQERLAFFECLQNGLSGYTYLDVKSHETKK